MVAYQDDDQVDEARRSEALDDANDQEPLERRAEAAHTPKRAEHKEAGHEDALAPITVSQEADGRRGHDASNCASSDEHAGPGNWFAVRLEDFRRGTHEDRDIQKGHRRDRKDQEARWLASVRGTRHSW